MDKLQLQVTADFSKLQEQFNSFSTQLNKYSNLPQLQEQISVLTNSFNNLLEKSKNLDATLSSAKGVRSFIRDLNSVNTNSKNFMKTARSTDTLPKDDLKSLKLDNKSVQQYITQLKQHLNTLKSELASQETIQKLQNQVSTQKAKVTKLQEENLRLQQAQLNKTNNLKSVVTNKNGAQTQLAQEQLSKSKNAKSTGTTKNGLLYKSADELKKEIELLQTEDKLISSIVNHFKDLTDIIVNKNSNIQKEVDLLQSEKEIVPKVSESLDKQSEKANKSSEDTVKQTTSKTANAHKELNNYSSQFFEQYNSKMPSLLTSLSTFQSRIFAIKLGVQGLMSAFGGHQLYNWLIENNAQIETLQKSMEVTMHDAEKAADTIRNLRSYAALTPFQEQETFVAGETLAANRMDVNSWIRTAGDLAAAKQPQGIELNDVINVVTRINSGDFGKAMIRLRQLGISLADFKAKGLEFSKNNTFLGTTDEMLNALQQIVSERYGGMTEVLGDTVSGSISTIQDFMTQIGIDLGEDMFGDFSHWLNTTKQELQDFRDSSEFQDIISNFNEAYETLKDFGGAFIEPLKTGLELFTKFLPEIAQFIKLFTTIKTIQGVLNVVDVLGNNWKMITAQQTVQNELIEQSNVGEVTHGTLLTNIQNSLAKIVALRKLGLQYANETATADAVAAGTANVKGSKYAANQMKNASLNAEADALTTGALMTQGAQGAKATRLQRVSQGLSTALIVLPIISLITGALKDAFTSNVDSKYSSDDYERISGDRITEVQRLEELNAQRESAKLQHDTYLEMKKSADADLNAARQKVDSNPQDTTAIEDYNNALKVSTSINDTLVKSEQSLISANKQLMTTAPELADKLVDSTGALTDNKNAFDQNTKAIQETIDARKEEIAAMKEAQLKSAEYEALQAEKQIEQNNKDIAFMQNSNRVTSNVGYFGMSALNSILGLVGLDGFKDSETSLKYGGLSEEDKQIKKLELEVNNYELNEAKQKADELRKDKQKAIEMGYVTGKGTIDWDKYNRYKNAEARNNQTYLLDTEKLTSRAEDIQESGEDRVTKVGKSYDVKLAQLKRKNGGDTTSEEYIKLEKEKKKALDEIYDQSISDINAMIKENETMKKNTLTEAKKASANMSRIADILESNPDISSDDILTALDSLAKDGDAIIDSKLSKYRDVLVDFLNYDLDGNLVKNLSKYQGIIESLGTAANNTSALNDILNDLLLEKEENLAEDSTKDSKSALDRFNDEWESKRSLAEKQKEIALQNERLNNNFEGSQKYKNTRNNQDAQLRQIILDEMTALNRLIESGALDEDETREAKQQLLELQSEANDLALEVADKESKTALGAYHDRWDTQNEIAKAKRDIALQQDQLNNFDTESSKYLNDERSLNMDIRDRLLAQAKELSNLIPTLDSENQLQAQLELLNLNKEANQILLDIKKNTSDVGEFNKPSFVKAMTYYDFMTQGSDKRSIEIGSASFVYKIDQIQNQEDINNMMALIQDSLGQHIANADRRGVVNPSTRG